MISEHSTHSHPVCSRLWLGGFGVALFLALLGGGLYLANPEHPAFNHLPGEDLIPSYMAGTFVREGRSELLMDYGAAARFQDALRKNEGLERHGRTGPWLNPPFFAGFFAPLAALPYKAALAVWFGFNLACLTASLLLLCRMLPGEMQAGRLHHNNHNGSTAALRDWRTWGLVPLLVLTSMPLIIAMACQQNTFLSLLILTTAVTFWRKGNGLVAGLVAGLLLFKPQLAVLVAGALVLSMGRRALLGLMITGSALLVITILALPGTIADYLLKLESVMPWLKSGAYYAWERQVTLHGFWRLLLQGSTSGPGPAAARVLWIASALGLAMVIGWAMWKARHCELKIADCRSKAEACGSLPPTHAATANPQSAIRNPQSPDRLIAAAIAAMPLLMPYYMDYDLLLLAVPAVLFAADVCRRGRLDGLDRSIFAILALLLPTLYVSSAIGAATRINPTVPLLAGLAVMLAVRVMRAADAAMPHVPSPLAGRVHALAPAAESCYHRGVGLERLGVSRPAS